MSKPIPVTADGSGPAGAIPIDLYGAGGGGGGLYPEGVQAFNVIDQTPNYSVIFALTRVGGSVTARILFTAYEELSESVGETVNIPLGFSPPEDLGDLSGAISYSCPLFNPTDVSNTGYALVRYVGDSWEIQIGVSENSLQLQGSLSWPTRSEVPVEDPLPDGWVDSI